MKFITQPSLPKCSSVSKWNFCLVNGSLTIKEYGWMWRVKETTRISVTPKATTDERRKVHGKFTSMSKTLNLIFEHSGKFWWNIKPHIVAFPTLFNKNDLWFLTIMWCVVLTQFYRYMLFKRWQYFAVVRQGTDAEYRCIASRMFNTRIKTCFQVFSFVKPDLRDSEELPLPYLISNCKVLQLQCLCDFVYRKFPKYSDTQKFVVITLKFKLCGSTIE